MDALDRVKYVLAQMPREDVEQIAAYLNDILVTPEEADAMVRGEPTVATVTSGRGGKKRGDPTVTYRQEQVKCGKAGCTKCPHGPYVYKYWREGGRLRKAYVGKALIPQEPLAAPTRPAEPATRKPPAAASAQATVVAAAAGAATPTPSMAVATVAAATPATQGQAVPGSEDGQGVEGPTRDTEPSQVRADAAEQPAGEPAVENGQTVPVEAPLEEAAGGAAGARPKP